jgi:hypothetical protein
MSGQLNGRRGDWFTSLKGHQIYPFDLRPEDIDIEEIAGALGNLCRFGGHLMRFYSVAQHSVLVSRAVTPDLARLGLLHDATEAYCSDMVRPLKRSPEMHAFRDLEDALWCVIAVRFDLPVEIPLAVKEADNRMLITERRDLVVPHKWKWGLAQSVNGEVQPYDFEIEPLSPEGARRCFLSAASRLGLR